MYKYGLAVRWKAIILWLWHFLIKIIELRLLTCNIYSNVSWSDTTFCEIWFGSRLFVYIPWMYIRGSFFMFVELGCISTNIEFTNKDKAARVTQEFFLLCTLSHIKIMLHVGSSRLTAYHIFALSMFNVLILFFRKRSGKSLIRSRTIMKKKMLQQKPK